MRTDQELQDIITGFARTIETHRRMTDFYTAKMQKAEAEVVQWRVMATTYAGLRTREEREMRTAHWELTTGHRAEVHIACERVGCALCEGGLTICTRCGGAEGSLLPRCPERRLTFEEDEANYFRNTVRALCPGECIGNYVDPKTGAVYPCEHQ